MERRWNLAGICSIALLLLATTAAAAGGGIAEEQETVTGAVSGKKFCVGMTKSQGLPEGTAVLSQRSSSYTPKSTSELVDDSYYVEYSETCFNLWYDESVDEHFNLQEETYADVYGFLEAYEFSSLTIETDIDFGGLNADSSCVASFMPLSSQFTRVDGGKHTIKNLCYVYNAPDLQDNPDASVASGVGFFSQLSSAEVFDMNFENVYMVVPPAESERMYENLVPAGVVAGRLGGYTSITNISLKNVKVASYVAGGVAGLVPESSSEVLIKDISGENVEVALLQRMVPSAVSWDDCVFLEISLGGVVGQVKEGIYIANANIVGLNVRSEVLKADKDYETGKCLLREYLGGLVGNLNQSNQGNVAIVNNYTTGNVSDPDLYRVDQSDSCKVGFLMGKANIGDERIFIANNYHYGESDYMAEATAGALSIEYVDVQDDGWKRQQMCGGRAGDACYNYRNTITNHIEPNGVTFDTTRYQWDDDNVNYYAGAIPARLMKKDDFAMALDSSASVLLPIVSSLSSDLDLKHWSRKDGVNNGLPVYANENLRPFYAVTFEVDYSTYSNLSESYKQKWIDAGAKEIRDQTAPDVIIRMELTVNTTNTGKLPSNTWLTSAVTMGSGDYYWRYKDPLSKRSILFPLNKSSVFSSSVRMSLSLRKSVAVRHGFLEYDNGEYTFYSVEEYGGSTFGGDLYFMGNPVESITSDSVWTKIPYLALYDYSTSSYQYISFRFAKKVCSDDSGDYCSFDTFGSSNFYADSLHRYSNGDTLYVIYNDYTTTFDELSYYNSPDGLLYVADLHGSGYGSGNVYVQSMGVTPAGERDLFGASEELSIQTETPASVSDALASSGGYASLMFCSPYLKVDYPSTTWENVDEILALVTVGYVSSSSGREWMGSVVSALANRLDGWDSDYDLSIDTVSALESPATILNIIKANEKRSVSYARYVRLNKNGELDLTNLMVAMKFVRENHQYEYPIYVGFLPKISNVTYHVTFDANYDVDYRPPYIATAWKNKKKLEATYTQENSNQVFFNANEWYVFRTDACYSGYWSNSPYLADFNIISLDHLEVMDPSYYTVNKDGSRSMTLYAGWETNIAYCEEMDAGYRVTYDDEENRIWNNRVIKDNSELGNVVLQQIWMGDTLRHKSESLNEGVTGVYVPYADMNSFEFQVYADGYPGYELDGDIKFVFMDYSKPTANSDGSLTSVKLKEGDTLVITPEMYEAMEFFVSYTYKKYNIEFMPLKKDVLYGENSPATATYQLKSSDDAIDLPRWVYTEDQCVEGWTARYEFEMLDEPYTEDGKETGWNADNPDWNADWPIDCEGDPECEAEQEERWWVYKVFNFELSAELVSDNGNRLAKYPLYAAWVKAETCVKKFGYKQAKLAVAENGLVEFKELLRDSTGKVIGSQVHKFAKDGTMLLPSGVKGSNFVVRGVPSKGYVLDSLVMILDGKTSVYHEGDTLKGKIATATFKAYFMPENPTPAKFAKADLLQSGSAVQFKFVTNDFAASGASVKIVLEDDDGKNVADTVIKISKTPYEGSWEYFPLRAGSYLLTATVSNSRSSDLFEKDFEVKSTIVSKADGWRMLSLSNVIMDSVTWDDDIRFYWWDDTKNYGTFWRYQRLMEEDEVDYLTGYWYSSLKGRPLVMRKDMNPPKGSVVWSMDSVYTGWNMVANPYGWYVDLYGENQDKKVSGTEQSDVEFWSWNDSLGAYEEVDVVGPYEAVWAKVKGPSKWKLPSKPAFVAKVDEEGEEVVVEPMKKTVKLASNGKNSWAIRAILRDAKGKRDGWNIMGVSESGWSSEEPPSGMGDHVNLSIKDGNKFLAKSFKKASGDSYEWTISLDASGDRTGYLHFEGIENLRAAGLKVFVTVDGTTTQMAENDTLKVDIGSLAKTATVRVAPSARTVVAQKLNGLRAFQSGNALQVGFQVSEGLAGNRAYVEILDMKGKVLSSASGTAVSGSNSMTLQAPKSGLYMVRVRVGSKQAAGSIAVK